MSEMNEMNERGRDAEEDAFERLTELFESVAIEMDRLNGKVGMGEIAIRSVVEAIEEMEAEANKHWYTRLWWRVYWWWERLKEPLQ